MRRIKNDPDLYFDYRDVKTLQVHDQAGEECMISHVISA